MSFKLRIADEAITNIKSDADWWSENRSKEQAREWTRAILTQINGLTETAGQCPRSREDGREGFPFTLFDKLVGLGPGNSHRAVFTIRDDTVFVLAVRSNRQDDLSPNDINTDLDSI